ncbi:alpha/beta hydrolase-fold protein [Blastopirellula sp. J2-11]|uniref:family 16 glycoside hydrolase n=1 Tax=Blastopirellula sp. J2-11 TaxID=2943192 RepID=UPI0021C99EBB|nr:alpha/beta hydrolase-fold protein [Blastopirellula sp. J2-11]UUO04988.1 alpha/beta hydrolase-fold protein [Blastopirellula sp. J2-11]
MKWHYTVRLAFLFAVGAVAIGAFFWGVWSMSFQSKSVIAHGFVETKFIDKFEHERTFLVYVPPGHQSVERLPLLLFLNGRGENGFDGYWTIENNFGLQIWENKQSFPFVCAIPQCAENKNFNGEQLEVALDFADYVAKEYGTDPDRFYITGVSQGGDGVWHAISKYPERFAAAVPLCGKPRVDAEKLAGSGLPIWNLYNQGDSASLVKMNEETRQQLLEAGASPNFTQYKQGGHDCWNLGFRSVGMWNWLTKQSRTPDRAKNGLFQLLSPQQALDAWTASPDSAWIASEDGSLVASSAVGDADHFAMLVSDLAYGPFDFHVDAIFGETASLCRIVLVESDGDSVSPSGLEIVLPLSEAGIGGVRRLNGEWIAALNPEAQRQLQADHANDIRIAGQGKHLELRINGWLAMEMPLLDSENGQARELRPAIVSDEGVSWKNLRVRSVQERG